MFTGLVQAVGTVAVIEQTDSGVAVFVEPPATPVSAEWDRAFETGESISVSGCCLTLARMIPRGGTGHRLPHSTGGAMSRNGAGHEVVLGFDVIPETLAKTTLGALSPGTNVNLERSATPMTLLGGHIVQGHVDGVGRVVSVKTDGEWRVRFEPKDAKLMEYIAPKGSVCVEGVSLTVAGLGPTWFEVGLIPVTLEKTTLGTLNVGDAVNLEMDAMAKMVVHWLRHFSRK